MGRVVVMPPGTPAAAVTALREALIRLNSDPGHAEDSRKAFGYVPVWLGSADNNTTAVRAMTFDQAARSFPQDYIKNPPMEAAPGGRFFRRLGDRVGIFQITSAWWWLIRSLWPISP